MQVEAYDTIKLLDNYDTSKPPPQSKRSSFMTSNSLSTVGLLTFWFVQNLSITFLNKRAMDPIRIPAALTMVHMIFNSILSYIYVHGFQKIKRQELKPGQSTLLFYFSLIFVSNIITGNWSLGLVSVSFNQSTYCIRCLF